MMLSDVSVTCPACGAQGIFHLHDSVNVTRDPQYKQAVLNGELFTYRCAVCGTQTAVSYPLLYHDMRRRILLRYCGGEGQQIQRQLDDLTAQSNLFHGTGYTLRSVETFEALIEKIRIFDAELDDRVVELCKLVMRDALDTEQPDLTIVRALFDMRDDTYHIAFIDEDGDVFAQALPDTLYNRLFDLCGEAIEEFTPDGFAQIDENWAREFSAQSLW